MSPLTSDGAATPGVTRREFATWLGTSTALAGLSGCVREPSETILPYVHSPATPVTGTNLHYATSMTIDGAATGLLVTSRDGRPIKVDGNPEHPASLGGSGAQHQASLMQLYDPDRARYCMHGNRRTGWDALAAVCNPDALHARTGARGAGLSLLLQPSSSPLESALLARIRHELPDARIGVFAPLAEHGALDATTAAFGTPLIPQYDFTVADVVVSLDADFLAGDPFSLRHAHDWAVRRRRRPGSILHVAETIPSPTGTMATERLAAAPDDIASIAIGLLATITAGMSGDWVGQRPALQPRIAAWIDVAAVALRAHRGRSIVIAGPRQPPAVHAAAAALNEVLGNVGSTVWYTPPPFIDTYAVPRGDDALDRAVDGDIDTVIITAVNPCYTAPPSRQLARRLRAIRTTIYLGDYQDETAAAVTWHAPAAHYLESWGDGRAWDGTISTVQPLIAPMYDGRTVAEMLALLVGEPARGRALLARYHPEVVRDDVLRLGFVPGSAFERRTPPVARNAVLAMIDSIAPARPPSSTLLSVTPSAATYDGRFAGNAWLQELPDPVTRLTWDNAALIAPALAERSGIKSGDVVTLHTAAGTIDAPALVVPGHADGVMSLALGYGRTGSGLVERGIGCNVTALRTRSASFTEHVTLTRTGRRHDLATTQQHWSIEGRRDEIIGAPAGAPPPERPALPLYQSPPPDPGGLGRDQWAMTIDLDLCTGCSACVVACQSENNIPVVGKAGVLRNREMHWIRIDRYLDGPLDDPEITVQPMLCQQCEDAPCEYVCPVTATTHSDDGLNEMVYNRCVGTRFCSNNCPYKVRRFNWLAYTDPGDELAKLRRNPDVTVRARGVMEKCTFCVQRIRHAQRDAELDGAPRTGTVVTACQQACPVGAIVFGSLTDPSSPIGASFNDPRGRSSLDELGTKPRVRYLARDRRDPVDRS